MTRHNAAAGSVNQRVLRSLSGPEKLRVLMTEQEGSVSRWAVRHGINPTEIYQLLGGIRAYPAHRERIAEVLGLSRKQVDRLLDAPAARTA
jgi:hypothetical protein